MRSITAAALSLSLLPAAGCINFDLGNGEANFVVAQVDAKGAGFGKKNINFGQIITLDLLTDEQRVGGLAVDAIRGQKFQIEISYLPEEMNRLEELLAAGNDDPRGQEDPTVFQVGDNRLQPFLVQMFVTYTRKEKITNDNGGLRNVKTLESRPAFCNFIDPIDPNSTGCFKFNANVTDGVQNIIGSVAGVGGETTISATFQDLIVYDPAIYAEKVEEILEQAGEIDFADPAVQEVLAESILVRIARDEPGEVFIFNANLANLNVE